MNENSGKCEASPGPLGAVNLSASATSYQIRWLDSCTEFGIGVLAYADTGLLAFNVSYGLTSPPRMLQQASCSPPTRPYGYEVSVFLVLSTYWTRSRLHMDSLTLR